MAPATVATRPLLVSECFGPTLQGEGPSAGQPALFVRLSRCNLSCRWCDTPYTWDWSRYDPARQTRRVRPEDLATWVLERPASLVVVTGGEPLLQRDPLVALVRVLTAAGRRVEVETNGTVAPPPELSADPDVRFNVSPKLANSGLAPARRIVPAALTALRASGRAVFKFVAGGVEDLDEVDELVARFSLSPVWVMPEGTTADSVVAGMRTLADAVVDRGWSLTPRLHVLLWDDARGR